MATFNFQFFKIQYFNHLKVVYTVAYLKCCIVIAYIHLINYSDDYTHIMNESNLELKTLNEIADTRGIREENDTDSINRINLEKLITNSGAVYKSEITNANLANREIEPKVFNSASEFLESVEDSPDSIWLVHIVIDAKNKEKSPCANSKFIKNKTWKKLTKLSKFNILTGTFNCTKDPLFCKLKGWYKPQLVLSTAKRDQYNYSKHLVVFFQYTNCKLSEYEHIFKWLEITLRKNFLHSLAKEPSLESTSSLNKVDSYGAEPKIFYEQSSKTTKQIPLFFSSISVKYKRRAKFYLIGSNRRNNLFKFEKTLNSNAKISNTPVLILIDNEICYQYGSNLNELPNHLHLNFFLIFLYPDMNSIFLISFFVLNSYLVMFFFEYNDSFLKQFARGFLYLCIFNFILFAIWLVTLNFDSKELIQFLNSILNKIFVWCRYLIMYNHVTQKLTAHFRFIIFYHIYIQSYAAIFLYILSMMLYYLQTKKKHHMLEYNMLDGNDKTDFNGRKMDLNFSHLKISESNTNSVNSNIQNRCFRESSSPEFAQPLQVETDIEISVHELISQINGPTSIWLQSSTYADRLLLELPHIEYCKCFFVNTIKLHACDETDIEDMTDRGETEDEEKANKCECGRNKELNNYLEQFNLHVKFRRECSICLDKYAYNCLMVLLPCGHTFHRQCIYEWFMNSVNYKLTCPICRTSFYKNKKIN